MKDIITVTTKDGLKNAVKAKYVTIVIGGECAQEIASSVRKNATGNTLSNIALGIGIFFPPALVAGVAGKFFTHEMKKYEIVDMDDEFVTIKRKKK